MNDDFHFRDVIQFLQFIFVDYFHFLRERLPARAASRAGTAARRHLPFLSEVSAYETGRFREQVFSGHTMIIQLYTEQEPGNTRCGAPRITAQAK